MLRRWSLGYPAAFLAHLYARTYDPVYLTTAERILDFASRCAPRSATCTRIHMWVLSVCSRRSAARARSVCTRAIPRRCNPDLRSNIVAHKVMWAASLVGNLSGKREHWDLVREISAHIIDVGQAEDGRVLNWAWERGTPYGEAQARADTPHFHAHISS